MEISIKCENQNTQQVLVSAIQIFSQYCDFKNVTNINIDFNLNAKEPISYKDIGQIFLCADTQDWCKVVYQLFHELCHCVIIGHVHPKFMWFEESICELSSYFFMEKLSHYWLINNVNLTDENGNPYACYFKQYAHNDFNKAFPYSPKCFHSDMHINSLLIRMQNNPILRELNANIAIILLPIFKVNPELWKTITYLGSVKSYEVTNALAEWKRYCPSEFSSSIDKVIKEFEVLSHDPA